MEWSQCNTLAGMSILLVWLACLTLCASAEDVKWLVEYKANALPDPSRWAKQRGDAVRAEIAGGALHIVDNSKEDMCCYRATWEADPGSEIVVEARVRVVSVKAWRDGTMHWPWRDGSPISILVSNGQRQEGLALCPERISTFMDRFHPMCTTDRFHVYRLVISGGDMSISVDGELKIRGKDAFWKPAPDAKPFIQFGSCSKSFQGEAYWDYVKLGVRPSPPGAKQEQLKITLSEPWQIPPCDGVRATRPYLYNVGEGILLMSVAQGPDKHFEPYGILKSTDQGKTWSAVKGLQEKTWAPQPMIRLDDGSILGVSRWNMQYQDYAKKTHYVGISYLFDPKAESFTMFENKIAAPKEPHQIMVFDRHIFDVGGGAILAVVYDGNANSHLLRTTDKGKTWTYFSMIGKGHEPGVAMLSKTDMTALLRDGGMRPLRQVWSHDGGKTWGEPTVLEEGSVDPDLVCMSNGVLACSYGRPGSNIMFSTDGGKTWDSHRVITDLPGFNYTTIREVSPGRLLYVHDAPPLTALYIDVERMK